MIALRVGPALLVVSTLLVASACKKPAAPIGRAAADPFAGMDCSAVQAPAEPDLAAWDADSRSSLDKLRKQGVVAVRYEARGCDVSLELIPQCVGPRGKYVYSAFSTTETKIARNTRDLLGLIPLGAANVAATVTPFRALRVDERFVGRVGLPAGTTITDYDLVGPECRRATHVVAAVLVGGFAIGATDVRGVETTNLFTAPPTDGLTREGSAPICDRAAAEGVELPGCAAPVRVVLAPVARGADIASKPSAAPACAADAGDCGHAPETSSEPRTFEPNTVERVVRERQGPLKRKCWEVVPEGLRRLNATVTGTIDRDGHVVDVQAQLVDSEGPAELAASVVRCLTTEVQAWPFPAPDKPVPFTVPFHFMRQ